MTETQGLPADPRPLLLRAADQIAALVAVVDDAELERPTPCPGWDVRTLVGHLVGVHRRIAHVGAGGDFTDIPTDQVVPDARRREELADARAALDAVWSDDAVLDRELTLPWGTQPGRVAALGYVQELTVHAWDLAVATGRARELDPGLAAAITGHSHRMVPAETRGGFVPFGPVVVLDAPAPPYDELVAWLGRDPRAAAGATP